MKYKRLVYTPVLLIITTVQFASASVDPSGRILEKYNHESKLEKIVAMWNRSSESSRQSAKEEETVEKLYPVPSFPSEMSKCIEAQQFEITADFSRGKSIILNCFKTSLMLTLLGRYLSEPSKSSVKLFNGVLEFEKIPESECREGNCDEKHNRNFGNKKDEYMRMYKKAMQKLINQRKRFKSYRNLTEAERLDQVNRIDANGQAFLSEVIRGIGDEKVEKAEEEKLRKEIMDPRLLSMLDALSKSYILRLQFYPGVYARMMRSTNGGFTFDLEIPESHDDDAVVAEEDTSSNESLTREIKDGSEPEDYSDENESRSKRGPRGKEDKQKKKKLKKLKKIPPYFFLPLLIQVALLPFVLKKLFFFAMKALLAGKVALILVAFNLLKNHCDQQEDYNHKIRVEHYGYKKGEEYGAWVNGRSMSEEPYRAYKPASD